MSTSKKAWMNHIFRDKYTYGWYCPGGNSHTKNVHTFPQNWWLRDLLVTLLWIPSLKIISANFKWDGFTQCRPKTWPRGLSEDWSNLPVFWSIMWGLKIGRKITIFCASNVFDCHFQRLTPVELTFYMEQQNTSINFSYFMSQPLKMQYK